MLLEDVEHAFVHSSAEVGGEADERTVGTQVKSSKVTFSGLLNAIDGVAAQVWCGVCVCLATM